MYGTHENCTIFKTPDPCLSTSKIFLPSWPWTSNFELPFPTTPSSPKDNQSIKRKHELRMTIMCYQKLNAEVTAWKVSKYGAFSGRYFPMFGPEKTPYMDTFNVELFIVFSDYHWHFPNRPLARISVMLMIGIKSASSLCIMVHKSSNTPFPNLFSVTTCHMKTRPYIGNLYLMKMKENEEKQ